MTDKLDAATVREFLEGKSGKLGASETFDKTAHDIARYALELSDKVDELQTKSRSVGCTWCGEVLYTYSPKLPPVIAAIAFEKEKLAAAREHDATCSKNPLVAQLQSQAAELERLRESVHDLLLTNGGLIDSIDGKDTYVMAKREEFEHLAKTWESRR